jgi:hypothetical protein
MGRFARGVDAIGATTLAGVRPMTRRGRAVADCGSAGGMDLPTLVAPFILPGASLKGFGDQDWAKSCLIRMVNIYLDTPW